MGFCAKHKAMFFDKCSHTAHRVVYVAITTGLCGSITSFSSYQVECNKSFFMQWDVLSVDAGGSTSGARTFEFLTCLLSGIAVPLCALHMGQHLASYSPYANDKFNDCDARTPISLRVWGSYEMVVLSSYIISTILATVVPTVAFTPPNIHITVTLLLASCGAYVRYMCSKVLNIRYAHFPLGTLVCNVGGSWLLAVVTVWAKLGTNTSNTSVISLLYGVAMGFCGCLTTVSTYVNELNALPRKSAYRYAFWSTVLAQFGIVIILNIPVFTSVPVSSVVAVPRINMCNSYASLCDTMLEYISCPAHMRNSEACGEDKMKSSDIASFVGRCECGDADLFSSSLRNALVLSQVRGNLTHNTYHLWPSKPHAVKYPLDSYDFCITYTRVCSDALNKIACPVSEQRIEACGYWRHGSYIGECRCGELNIGTAIRDIVISHVLQEHSLASYVWYAMAPPIDFCSAAETLCDNALDAMLCPESSKRMEICKIDTYVGGCSCSGTNNIDIDSSLSSSLVSARVVPRVSSYLNFTSASTIDICSSYSRACMGFLDSINCSSLSRKVMGCTGMTADTLVGVCGCDSIDVSRQVGSVLTSSVLQRDISQYSAPSVTVGPYSLAIGGRHFAILNH